MVDGGGDPNVSEAYKTAIQWLYSLSYTLKFASRRELGRDYTVAPLEGLWWADDLDDFTRGDKSRWRWTMMIMQPDWTTEPMFDEAVARCRQKLGAPPPGLRLEDYHEGLSVQIMHVGPYSAEGPTLARL